MLSLLFTSRSLYIIKFNKIQRHNVGKNILLNRFHDLNNLIFKQWMNLSLETYKIKCKALFLQNGIVNVQWNELSYITQWQMTNYKCLLVWSIKYNLNVLFLDHNKQISSVKIYLPWCIFGLGVYFKQFGLQVFRPASQSMVSQSTLQPSSLIV